MIEIKDKEGKSLFKTELEPKDLNILYDGNLQGVTSFELDDDENCVIKLNESLLRLLYGYWWGND